MHRIVKLEVLELPLIQCFFDSGDIRILDLSKTLNDKFASKILSHPDIFYSVKIGEFGELYWENAAEIILENGTISPCNYDISAEFAYQNSEARNISISEVL